MAGRRHHTLPRFLLKGFASSKRRKHVSVWMYRKGGTHAELNIENVGVEKDFYGGDQELELYGDFPKLDDRITSVEDRFGKLLARLRDQDFDHSPLTDPLLAGLIAHLCIRSRQFRQSALESMDVMIQQTAEGLSSAEVVNKLARRQLENGELKARLMIHLKSKGVPETEAKNALDQVMQDRDAILQTVAEAYPQLAASMRTKMELYRSVLPDGVRAAYITAISKNFDSIGFTTFYENHNWFLLDVRSLLLLGDSGCIFETDGKRRFRILPDGTDQIKRIYLPISSNRLLIGSATAYRPEVNLAEINKAVARCSFDFFVVNRQLESTECHFSKNIGLWAGVIGKSELASIIEEILKEHRPN
jgi:hypothetical protein